MRNAAMVCASLLLMAACSPARETAQAPVASRAIVATQTTSAPATATPIPPTATAAATATPLPPTATALPPTATPLPPTATPIPPTPTQDIVAGLTIPDIRARS